SGGAIAPDGCLVLDLSAMTRILELSAEDRLAVVEPGVINAALSAAAAPHGLMYAPDPSSWETSTIGGNIATNAGGLRCIRYGATRASVLGLTVVLADGRLLRTGGRTLKRSAGYDLTQLLVGSEGTLGIVVEATVRLHPLPPPQLTALITFPGVMAAAATAAALVDTGPPPLLLELMDALHVRAIDELRGTGFGSAVGAVLVLQLDDAPDSAATLHRIADAGGASDVALTTDAAEARDLLDIRRAAYPAMQRVGRTLVEDVCVPRSRLADMVAAVEQTGADTGVLVGSVAHAGDGNVHPILVLPEEPDGNDRLWAAADQIFRTALQLGGTVSGEHGIGRLKRRWLADEVGTTSLDVQRAIKSALDPTGILNPGAIFEP
ncbi:MAG TPA: FAD-linked oxidase C-terminal domain-containing protein, partial [Mycobacteriales bacterium]|nr:FAD-linked oxidase C-terminal domain-containing protein [Mycobacteriales bacterium]